MRAPFARAAEGVRLPDGNPNTSVTFALTRKLDLTTDSGGNLDVVVLPTLETNVFSTNYNIGGDGFLAVPAETTTANTYFAPGSAPTARGARFDTVALRGMYSRIRIVAYGVRLRCASGINTAGEFTVAVLPLKGLVNPLLGTQPSVTDGTAGTIPINSWFGPGGPRATVQNMLAGLGLPYVGTGNSALLDISKLVNIPQHAVISASEASARGVHVRGMPFEAAARDYRSTTFSAVGTDSIDVATASSTTYTGAPTAISQQFAVDLSPYKVGGHESCVIGGAGFPASTKVATIELIYHCEAIMDPSYSLLARPTGTLPIVPPGQTLDSVLATLHRIPRISFADVVTQAGDAMLGELEGRVVSAGKAGLGSLAGALARLVMSSV